MNKNLLSIIIVNYNSGNILKECIDSIFDQKLDFPFEVIIVDNASGDNSMDLINDKCKKILLDENLGFARANNIGVDNSDGKYLYFLNPDTVLLDGNLKGLLDYFIQEKRIGIVAPQVLNSDKSIQLTCRKEPSLNRLFFYLFGINRILPKNKNVVSYKMELDNYDSVLFPDWVSGAAFIISRDLFTKLGKFNENIFMYWEDVSLCREVRSLGYKIVYNPISTILHYGGVSSGKVKLFSSLADIKSRLYYFTKYYSSNYSMRVKIMSIINLLLRGTISLMIFRFKAASVYYQLLLKTIML